MMEPGKLTGADEMDAFVNERVGLICDSETSGQIGQKRRVFVEPLVAEASYKSADYSSSLPGAGGFPRGLRY